MSYDNKTLSVIIPSYNHSSYISHAIKSVLCDSNNEFDIQLIVIDDCSLDQTLFVVEQLLEKFEFEFYRNEENLGLTKTLEKSISLIRGEYVCFLASDDFFLPGRIKKQLNEIKKSDADVVYGLGKVFDSNCNWLYDQDLRDFSKELDKSQVKAFQLMAVDDTCGPLFQSAILKVEVVREIADLWKEYKSDDWVVLLYLLKNKKVALLNDFVFGYRLHDKNTHKQNWKMLLFRLDVVFNYLSKESPELQREAISNLFVSHAAALYRNGEKRFALSFFISSLFFFFPYKKLKKYFKRVCFGI